MNVVFNTLIDALDKSATTDKGICFIKDLVQDEFVSYAQLKVSAIRILAGLQNQGIKPGDELVLQYVSLKPMMETFWACLLGGIIPIPLALADQGENARKVFTIWKLLKKPVLAFDDENTLHKLQDYAEKHGYTEEWQLIQQSLYDSNSEQEEGSLQAELADVKPENIAFIQFSSGSTGTPKGVLLTHKNLLSNAFDIMASVDHTADDSFLSWKPISHDFGMIGFHITPLVGLSNQYRIPTDAYIWSPSLWFRAVNKYRATLLGSPNFGYRHFLKLYKRNNSSGFDWDLSCVKAIFNGAEPISTDLCEEFCNELKQYGLSQDVMRCGYGLAEGSLISSLCLKGDGVNQVIVNRQQIELAKKIVEVDKQHPNAISVVDCGIPYPNTQIRIASTSGRTVGDGTIGYVEIKGNSVTKGYYRNKEETQKAIKRSGWLNTQDLGFMLNGRLFIAGRSKEMIIVGGSNYFPHDIEQAILAQIGIHHLNHVIACSVKEKGVEYKNGVPTTENQLDSDEVLALFVYHKKGLDTFHESIEQLKTVVLNAIGIKAAYVIPVKKIPKTTSGKIQRFELIKQFEQGYFDQIIIETGQFDKQSLVYQETKKAAGKAYDSQSQSGVSTHMNDQISRHQLRPILKIVIEFACKALGVNSVPEDAGFFDLGLTSMKLIAFQEDLEEHFNVEVSSTSALDFPTAYKLAECFYRELTKQEHVIKDHAEIHQNQASNDDIAIISIACRFPGTNGEDVKTPEEFWHLLSQGLDPVREVSRECWKNSSLDKEELSTREGGFLNDVDQFDPHFFGISPTEADAMDPQQRLLLEVSYQAFENAGFDVDQIKGKNIGTYVGISGSDYVALSHEQSDGIGPYSFTGSMFNTAAGRISYAFGLEGPCMAIDTACSSSLVSIHQACRELKARGCDAALVSAVNLMLKPDGHLGFTKMNALSETGRCRSFDDSADGYIRSEGCAALVLKRVDDAQRDGDPILAVIKGSAINHNGRSGGLTVPSGLAQQAVIGKALKDANLSAQDIDYVEAHGSGTKLGDPQELAALSQVFANRERDLYLGSVKSNIGHCESAAGLAGTLKMVLSLTHQQLPPNLHFQKPNSIFAWQKSPIKIVDRLMPWPNNNGGSNVDNLDNSAKKEPIAAITSLGINGSNAHLILQGGKSFSTKSASTKIVDTSVVAQPLLFTFSAKSKAALFETLKLYRQQIDILITQFGNDDELGALYQLSQAMHFQRSRHNKRYVVLAKDANELKLKLDRYIEKNIDTKFSKLNIDEEKFANKNIVFLFTGQGSEYLNMGDELYQNAPVYRDAFDQCDQLFSRHLKRSIKEIILDQADADILAKTDIAQAAIFSIEYALACYWQALGIKPQTVLGHSIGEYAAACIAGVVTLAEAIEMVALRGQVMVSSNAHGRMVGVLADRATVDRLMSVVESHYPKQIFIAAYNAEENFTLSGTVEAIELLVGEAKKARVFTDSLPMKHAYHSPLMQASSQELKDKLQPLGFKTPQLSMLSSKNGDFINDAGDISADYWGEHLSSPVRYQQALEKLVDESCIIVEIGAKAILTGLAAQTLSDAVFVPSLREGRDACRQFHESLALVYTRGANIDWHAFHNGKPEALAKLPNTSFYRDTYWLAKKSNMQVADTESISSAPLVAQPLRSHNVSILNASQDNDSVVAKSEISTITNAEVLPETIESQIIEMISEVIGIDEAELSKDVHLFSLGMDSLMFVKLDKRIRSLFQVEISIKDFFSEIHTPERIASHIFDNMPAELRIVEQESVSIVDDLVAPQNSVDQNILLNQQRLNAQQFTSANSDLAALVQSQLAVMQQQLVALSGQALSNQDNQLQLQKKSEQVATTAPVYSKGSNVRPRADEKLNLRDIVLHRDEINSEQQDFVNKIIQEVNLATPKSKLYAQKNRQGLADWIATLNFSLTTKEITYPLVSAHSKGARFTDIDDNEYIDTAMGYGVNLFGHNPDFITQALSEQLAKGLELGPQSRLVGEVVDLIKELTGVERVAFVNSGTEAVMVSLRVARAVTKRDKIVRFTTSYHGSFDGILADNDESGVVPMAPGIPQSMVNDTLLMSYGSALSLRKIEEQADSIAAVLVEPVQSRNPALQPDEYLQQLRALTERKGIALIFDEMIVGFRSHPGGAQAYFGVQADLVTYGKVIGGGMPIGVVAGSHDYMDAIDGGSWQFSDESGPQAETTFFAGTFCKHPLTMAAAKATLLHLKTHGYQLQKSIADMTEQFAARVNHYFKENHVPIELKYFSSMYRLEPIASVDMLRLALEMNLFFKLIQLENVFVWERRVCFFSSAHTEEDVEKIFLAIKNAVIRLRAGGFSFTALDENYSRQANSKKPLSEVCYDLSSEERRMYVLSHMKFGEQAYRICGALKVVASNFNVQKLENCLQQLVRRHACLRSYYNIDDTGVYRSEAISIQTPFVYSEEPILDKNKIAPISNNLDVDKAPLWQVRVFKQSASEYLIILDFNHLIADGLSTSLIIEELFELYQDRSLPPVGDHYSQYVLKQDEFLKSDDFSLQKSYWKNQLSSPLEALELPADFERPLQKDFLGAAEHFEIDEVLTAQLKELAKEYNVTPFLVLFSSYFVLLNKLTHQHDICVGLPFDNRGMGNFERSVGMFAQTLAIRNQLTSELNFTELLEQVKEASSDAYMNADLPLDTIVDSLDIKRDTSRNAIFDCMFIYEKGSQRLVQNDALTVTSLPIHMKQSPFDLTLEITEEGEKLRCSLIYSTGLYKQETVKQWKSYFIHLLNQIVAQPQQKLANLGLLSKEEKNYLLEDLNQTGRDYPSISVNQLLQQSFSKNAQNTALVDHEQNLSYQQLDAAANQLASHLASHGASNGRFVGILLDRNINLIVSILAVLKTGAAYLPLDPSYPESRLSFMLDKAEVELVISNSELVDRFTFLQSESKTIIQPDVLFSEQSKKSFDIAPVIDRAKADDLAYIIFTSGSSGQPKGVMVEHANMVNFVLAMQDALPLPTELVTLGLTTQSFDIFVLELFVTLSVGGCLVLANEEEQKIPDQQARLMLEHKVNFAQMTPSRLSLVLKSSNATQALGLLDVLLVGGEAFPKQHLSKLQSFDNLRIFNVYGPTETTVWSCIKELTQASEVAIGKPIANTQAYILDKYQQLLPAGKTGYIYLSGDGVSRGYFKEPAKNAQAFFKHPFIKGKTIYDTGDRGYWNADGELVYCGRNDFQVKLRGYRIELQDIEHCLLKIDHIDNAAVVVRELSEGNSVLVAFYTLSDSISEEAVKNHLRLNLPEFMVPSVLVEMAELPTTENGKIARNKLPAGGYFSSLKNEGNKQRIKLLDNSEDKVTKEIKDIWKELTNAPQIGLQQSFFDIGGNSFNLILMHNKLDELYPNVIDVTDLFNNPTIAAIREIINSENTVPIELSGIDFPTDFFDLAGNSDEKNYMHISFDLETHSHIRAISKRHEIGLLDVLLSAYALYLNKKFQQQKIDLYFPDSKNQGCLKLGFDFNQINQLDALFDHVRETKKHLSSTEVVRPKMSNSSITSTLGRQITHLFLSDDAQFKTEYNSVFDITFQLLINEDALAMRVDSNQQRLSERHMRAFINDYSKLIKAVVTTAANLNYED